MRSSFFESSGPTQERQPAQSTTLGVRNGSAEQEYNMALLAYIAANRIPNDSQRSYSYYDSTPEQGPKTYQGHDLTLEFPRFIGGKTVWIATKY